MKKRAIAWLMAAAMVLSLAGCGGGNEEQEEEPEATQAPEEAADAVTWKPEDTVTLIVPYSANSISDITVKVLTQYVEQIIGQDIEIENVPGPITEINEAGEATEMDGPGSQGWLELSKRKPDGLTIGVADLPGFSDSLARQAGYYTVFDFTPVCNHVMDTAVLVARDNDERFGDIQELLGYAAEHPGELVAATDGEHGASHAWMETFARSAGISYGPKHCGNIGDAVQSVLSGGADVCVMKSGDLYGRTKGLRVLTVFGGERLSGYPDAPTAGEMGCCDKWLGEGCCILGPAGMPQEAVAFYEQAFEQAMTDSRYLSASTGITTYFMDAADTAALIAQQRAFSLSEITGLW